MAFVVFTQKKSILRAKMHTLSLFLWLLFLFWCTLACTFAVSFLSASSIRRCCLFSIRFLSLINIVIEFYVRLLLDRCFFFWTTFPCCFAWLGCRLHCNYILAPDCSFDRLSLSHYIHLLLCDMLFGAASVFSMDRLIRDVLLDFVDDNWRLIWRQLLGRNDTTCTWNHSFTNLRDYGLLICL